MDPSQPLACIEVRGGHRCARLGKEDYDYGHQRPALARRKPVQERAHRLQREAIALFAA